MHKKTLESHNKTHLNILHSSYCIIYHFLKGSCFYAFAKCHDNERDIVLKLNQQLKLSMWYGCLLNCGVRCLRNPSHNI